VTIPARLHPIRGAAAVLAGSLALALSRIGTDAAEPPAAEQTPTGQAQNAEACRPLSLHGALPNPRPGDLFMRPGAATCDQAEVEVTADEVAGVFTVSFDMRYPATLVKYSGFTLGPLLQRAPVGTTPLCLVQEPVPGMLQVTMTRFAPDRGVLASGSETLLVLRFTRVAAGSGDIDFNLDPASSVPERIVDDAGATVAARFGPGHGLKLTVYQR
jgi:hypothetical protein